MLRNLSTSDTASEKSKSYDRNYITESRAINEYLLDKVDLKLKETMLGDAFDECEAWLLGDGGTFYGSKHQLKLFSTSL